MAVISLFGEHDSIKIIDGNSKLFYKTSNLSIRSEGNKVELWDDEYRILGIQFGSDTVTINGDSIFDDVDELMESLNLCINYSDTLVGRAINGIARSFGDTVSLPRKGKKLSKFGQNTDLGTTEETVWQQGGKEVLATGNDIDTVSSSNDTDTQNIIIEGHTLSGSDLTFVIQTATLTGQTGVTLSTPLYRATKMYNDNGTDFSGDVYLYESGGTVTSGVPQVSDDIHLKAGADNQSLKCQTSLSSTDYWAITSVALSVDRQQSRAVDFKLKIKEFGKVWRTRLPAAVHSSGGTVQLHLDPPIIAKPNSDIRMDATSSGINTEVEAIISGHLLTVL